MSWGVADVEEEDIVPLVENPAGELPRKTLQDSLEGRGVVGWVFSSAT